MATLPSGIKTFEASDNVVREAFNENWNTINNIVTTDATTSARGMMSSADKLLSANRDGYGTTAGTATAYTITLTPAPTMVDGLRVTVKLNANNGANPTLNVNGLGAKAILKPNGTAPAAGLLKLGSVYTLVYNGTAFILQGEGGEYGTAVAADVLAGKTIGTESGLVTGTMVDRAGDTAALSSAVSGTTLRLRASAGYRDGTNDFVTINDPDFIAANIRQGIDLFGIVGSLIEGKRYASGTVPKGTGYLVAQRTDGVSSGVSFSPLTVSGLTFKPSIVIIRSSSNAHLTFYTESLTNSEISVIYNRFYNNLTMAQTAYAFRQSSNFNSTSDGFVLPAPDMTENTTSYSWFAIE
ncbi:hypothetical protein B1748_29195 [Paenibacillus sp. MY03]|uniref:hypothetical protein n=1 Tax=Paenibacillus sp. MY03 TaxID=302980 RepID=UPI000B3C83DE|nr:hypothetical protein [Paenibacillus sp. MY03]OUS70313.1 hypothetical protein B1748_29195 [Paenibacillus sp. MY03]